MHTTKEQQKMIWIVFLLIALGIAATLVIDWFTYNPRDLNTEERVIEVWLSWPARIILIVFCLGMALYHYYEKT